MIQKLFLTLIILFTGVYGYPQSTEKAFASFERAKHHPITSDRPAIDFFEGALLGNGGMGVVVTTRPDGILLHFGHNNVWDIRIAEDNREKIGTFKSVFEKVSAIPDTLDVLIQDPWYNDYRHMARENYAKPYPRPFPCGSVLLGFDRREVELLGHTLDISNGLCEVFLLVNNHEKATLQLFVDQGGDKLWLRLIDARGSLCGNVFDRARLLPDPSTPGEFPEYTVEEKLQEGIMSFRQVLPYQEPEEYDHEKGHPGDHAFRLSAAFSAPMAKASRINWDGNEQEMAPLEGRLAKGEHFIGCVSLTEGNRAAVRELSSDRTQTGNLDFTEAFERSETRWKDYWERSGVALTDNLLESIWYRNLYFFNCAVQEGATTPGLFANWSFGNIGTAWHGDYHMNYNTQQPFWLTFSSNHLEKNLAYVQLIEFLMGVSKKWAKEYYELPGAFFPHSAYPVDMTMNPYPVPTWGWEVCETPWAVQGLWWHFLYAQDVDYLRKRAYEPIKAAVQFLVAYMKRPEARGPQWGDDKFHIFPTVPPELYGLRPGFKYNYDCNADLSLTKFIFKAFETASGILGTETAEKDLLNDIDNILSHFPDYPTAISEDYGEVLVSVPGEHSEVVYNVPLALFTVFPGEDHGLPSDQETMKLLKNTYRNQQNEGGNDLVFKNLQAARIGMLDIEAFKRQVKYCILPNGTASNRVLQVHGRYRDLSNYGFMDNMGIWFENFALPVVVNECLMQSYDGTIRLFPNWPLEKDAEFYNLRAVGAFLVSASVKEGRVPAIRVVSEAGAPLRIVLPWVGTTTMERNGSVSYLKSGLLETDTEKGEIITLFPSR
jgi:hypothetical protein